MKLIKPSYEILTKITPLEMLKFLEECGRTCYKSEDHITEESAKKFIKMILDRGHESVIEHISVSVRVITDRGVSHEQVRHRIASYSQESTRYCNYSKDKFGNELTFIRPCFWKDDDPKWILGQEALVYIESIYNRLIEMGATPQEARYFLPNGLKTEYVVTKNLRSWRNFFKQRVSKTAHPQMREIACPMLDEFKINYPIIFDDITY